MALLVGTVRENVRPRSASNGGSGAMAGQARRADVVVVAAHERTRSLHERGICAGSALTVRERDVLRLLAEGRSNAEIAAELVIGIRTARMHVANILAKLGVANRTAAAAHAIRYWLV